MKKLFSVILSAILLLTSLCAMPFSAAAYLDFDFSDSGSIGDYEERPEFAYNDPKNGTNVTYTFDSATGTLVLTHHPGVDASGRMANYDTSPFAGKTEIKHLIVNEGVTGFCSGAFKNCTSLIDISLPSTLSDIASNAFANCTSLKSVMLKGGVKRVGSYAFYGCTALESVTLNDGLEVIDSYCFESCESLEGIIIPQSVTEIHAYAFTSSGIKSLTVNNSECTIYPDAFNNCRQLVNINLGTKAVLKSYAFSYCTALKSIAIPGTTQTVLKGTFYSCTALENLILLSGVKSIEDEAFDECEAIKTVRIPKSLTSVEDYTFRNCTAITDVYYEGTQADWNSISFGKKNEPITGANIHFNSASPTDDPSPENQGGNTPAPTDTAPAPAPDISAAPAPETVAAPTAKKAAAGKNSFTASWTKVDGATAYEVQYCTNKKFKKAKTKKVKASKSKVTIKKLKSKKTYYVRIRSVKGTTKSAWSKTKKVKIK